MHTGQGDRLNLPFSKLLVFHDHDIDLGLGHMACHRISFIGMCLHTTVPHFIEIGKMDGQQDLLHSEEPTWKEAQLTNWRQGGILTTTKTNMHGWRHSLYRTSF